MKREKIMRAFSDIDAEYVAEAQPEVLKFKKQRMIKLGALAACICIMVTALSLWMFIPFSKEPPDVSEYKNSEYYPIIEKLNVATYRQHYKNNFQKIMDPLRKYDKDDSVNEATGTDGASNLGYRETTDNQVQGVIEADILKANNNHFFYMNEGVVRAYGINGEETEQVGEYEINIILDEDYGYSYFASWDMYLSADGRTLTVVAPYGALFENGGRIAVVILDVSDPSDIKEKKQILVNGSYRSSRLTNGEMLLFTVFSVGTNPDFSEERNFLPQYDMGDGFVSIPAQEIVSPDVLSSAGYTVVWRIDPLSGELKEHTAYLSYTDELYVSNDNIYVTRRIFNKTYNDDSYKEEFFTEITGISYTGECFRQLGAVTVKGYLNDQYSLDEYNGILRVAATTQTNTGKVSTFKPEFGEDIITIGNWGTSANASLYCIDISSWQIVAAVENFAPEGETVRSVRFDGDKGYICTAIMTTDPVYFFDLSDITNITYTDTGTIPGFSTSLIQLKNGYLLGIGQGGRGDIFKIEVYKEENGSVNSVCEKIYKNSYWSRDYKSYMVDRENGLVGLGVTFDSKDERYMLFHFNGEELELLVNETLAGDNGVKRAVYIDGYLYMFGEEGHKVSKIL